MSFSPLIPAKAGARFAASILIWTLASFTALSNMAHAAAKADESINTETQPRLGGWFPTECPDSVTGAGSDPSDPILIEDYDDILSSARFWSASEEEQQRSRSYFREGESPPPDLNCRYVRISGHFRHRPYHDYRGVMASSARDLYLNGGPGNFIREGLYFIESWSGETTSSILLNGADVTIVGRYYDLCRAARQARAKSGDLLIVMGGPCHYGDLTGQMLKDVTVVSASNPAQRLQGEENRKVIGDLERLPVTWKDYDNAYATAQNWVRAVREGAENYYQQQYGPSFSSVSKQTRTFLLQESLADRDSWIWFLAGAVDSPIARRKPQLDQQPFAIFEITSYRRGVNRKGVNAVVGCFCTRKTCEGSWPILNDDAKYFFDPYVCVELRRDRNDPTNWNW